MRILPRKKKLLQKSESQSVFELKYSHHLNILKGVESNIDTYSALCALSICNIKKYYDQFTFNGSSLLVSLPKL